mmetsp:Transcript_104209/g.200053  ORF Transcript_104209/g.200053 Transcript_104209/m.200053 type:complete len:201 (-) Transcript_104209:12-614(-)
MLLGINQSLSQLLYFALQLARLCLSSCCRSTALCSGDSCCLLQLLHLGFQIGRFCLRSACCSLALLRGIGYGLLQLLYLRLARLLGVQLSSQCTLALLQRFILSHQLLHALLGLDHKILYTCHAGLLRSSQLRFQVRDLALQLIRSCLLLLCLLQLGLCLDALISALPGLKERKLRLISYRPADLLLLLAAITQAQSQAL